MKIKRILSMTFALVMLLGMAVGMSQTAYAEGNTTTITPTNTSGTMTITLTIAAAHSVTVTPGEHMTKTADSGEASQSNLSGAMADVVYTANDGYYFPTDYSVATVNGISVTRDSYTQITVSGTPTADAAITLTAPTAKTTPAAPTTAVAADCTTADNNDGKLTGVTAAMEYKKSDATDWTAGTGSDITGLVPGTYYVRVKATETTLASDNQELTIASYTAPTYSVTVTPGSNMTKTEASGAPSQTGLSGAMTDVVYTADEGYYFLDNYSVAAVNGISVTRDSYTQITVSGTPTADAAITLTAPTAKTKPDAPTTAAAVDCTTADNNDGTLTGVTTAMEYKKSDAADWTAGTDSDITGLVPGTYYVRVKATDTTLASDNQELTIKGFISYTVTFKVVSGSWDDETTEDKTVTLTGHDGDTLKLTADQIPAVGTKPADTYKAGAWDVVPSTETAITAATTYTYTYAAKDGISQTVTFKVINGSWDDETTTDKTVTLTGYEGDTLKLAADQIPTVGTKPNDTYKAGAWDVVPSTETAITAATTYTYTYAAKDSISQTVTFKVVNGSWDNGDTADITVTLTGLEGDTLKLAENQIPAVGTKPADTYKAGAWDVVPSTETAITAATTYTYTYAAKNAISQTVTFKVVNGSWDNGNSADITVTLSGLEGDTLKLAENQIPAVGTKPADTYKAGAWDVVPSTDTAITAATTYTYTYAAKDGISQTVTFKVVNGSWDDGNSADITVTLTGLEGDTLKLAENQIPAVGTKPADTYKAGAWDVVPSTETAITAATTYTYTYAAKDSISQTVTFKVVNGSWDNGDTADITVTLTGLEGDTLKLAENQIPAVGTKPADTYKAGAWDVVPSTDTAITAATTYTYTYAAKDGISQTVTFKVVNGSWDDGNTADITVTLTGLEGDTLKLAENQIPAVGTKPADTYKAGAWDVVPSTDTEITAAATYTYTYAAKDGISQTVTFKVVNGSWDDGNTADITVTLTGLEGDTLKLAENQIPAVGAKPNADFEAGSWDVTPSTETEITSAKTYTYTYAAKDYTAAQNVIDAINSLPAASDVTTANKDAIEAARAAYDVLAADQKAKVSADTLNKLTDVETALAAAQKDAADTAAASDVSEKINALPAASNVTLSNGPDIQAARNAYNALTDYQKTKISEATLKKLADAETALAAAQAAADQEAADTAVAQAVTDKINALPASATVTTADKAAIEAARAAYDALTNDQKAKVSEATLKKLIDAETALAAAQAAADQEAADTAAAQAVTDKINALPASADVALTDKEAIEDARKAYNALTNDQKAKVNEAALKKLTDAETAIAAAQAAADQEAADTAAAQAVTDKINALPASADVALTDKEAIEDARKAYNALTNDQKAKIKAETLQVLADCETALDSVLNPVVYTDQSEPNQNHRMHEGNLVFTFKRNRDDEKTFSLFDKALVDNNELNVGENCTIASGSLILTLKDAYLDTLAVGEHTLTVLFADGRADSRFTVSRALDPTNFDDMAVPSDSFTFKVIWNGGSDKNIDFTLYRKDGTVYHHGFDKKALGSGEWRYSAWFSSPEACYIIEKPMEGYQIRYENAGVYAQVTDRCCDGGVITIYKVPKTGDAANLALWMSMVVIGAMTLCGVAVIGKRRKQNEK